MMKSSLASLLLVCSSAASLASAEVLKLDEDNYRTLTEGKTVFLKMFAPWCGHCKAMAPAWEQVASEWKDHAVGLVGEIDCTAPESESLCEVFGVEAFPTIMYGDPSSPDEYQGGRDYESLSQFAKENIGKPVCSISKPDACSEEDQKKISDLKAKSKDELLTAAGEVDDKVGEAQAELDDFIEKINDQYEEVTAEFNKKMEKLKADANYKWIRQILQTEHGVDLKPHGEDHDDEDDMDDEDDDELDDHLDDDDIQDEL